MRVDAKLAAGPAASVIEEFTAKGETVARLGEVVAGDGKTRVDFRGRLDLSL